MSFKETFPPGESRAGFPVARNPFARGEYARYPEGAGDCGWCGQRRRVLYRYVWESDAAPWRNYPDYSAGFDHSTGFCNIGCYRLYHS